jgi:hypothetical protein
MATLIQLFIGALACLAFILVARRAGFRRERAIYAAALACAALIYVGFAAAGGASMSWVVIALGGLALFSLIALLGVRVSLWALALGWAAHAAWDVLLHKTSNVGFVPEWYPFVCIGFDLLLAAYLIARSRERRGRARVA